MTDSGRTHETFIDNMDILRVVYHGNLDSADALRIHKESMALAQELLKAGKKLLALLDIRELRKHDPTARWIGREEGENLAVSKIAVLMENSDAYLTKILQISVDRSKHREKFMYFKKEQEAVDWLLETT